MSRMKRVFSADFKLKAVTRMLKGENISALARELEIRRKLLYLWKDAYRQGGVEHLRSRGRPLKELSVKRKKSSAGPKSGRQRVAELERKVAELERKLGQKDVELDFFETALQRIEQDRTLATGSLKSSARRRSKAD